MFWYLFFATVPVWMSLAVSFSHKKSIKLNDKAKQKFLLLCGIFMFAIIAFRHKEVGSNDSQNYFNNWELLSGFTFDGLKSFMRESSFEKGYLLFVWFFSHIFPEGQFVFIISALIFTIAVCRFIYINSEDPELSFVMFICLGLYSFMVQGLRQAIAMSICLFAIEFCKKRKIVPFILLVLLATSFHTSAIVFLIVYFIYGFTLNVRTTSVAVALAGFLLAFSGQIASIGNMLFEREYEEDVETGGFVAVAIYVIILLVAIIFSGKRRKEKDYSFFVFMTFLGAVFYTMRYTGVLAAERISFYFMFGQIIALPNVISRFDKHVSFIIKCAVIVLCIALFAYRLSGDGLVVYRFFWQEIM